MKIPESQFDLFPTNEIITKLHKFQFKQTWTNWNLIEHTLLKNHYTNMLTIYILLYKHSTEIN